MHKKEKSNGKSKLEKREHFWERAFSNHTKLFAFLLISLVAGLLYINSIHNEFVFDDLHLIPEYQSIRSLTRVPQILGITTGRSDYRPIRGVSYSLDYYFTGLNPVGYHLSNIFYHILVCYLVFLVSYHLSRDRRIALVAALLFTTHPIQTEAVTYISGRRDILCGLFFMMGFYFFLRYKESPSRKYFSLSFASYLLSIFSKEMGVTLPALLILYDLIETHQDEVPDPEKPKSLFTGLFSRFKEVLKRNWAFYLVFFGAALLFTLYKVLVRNPSHQEGFYGGKASSNFLTVLNIWVFYIKLLIFPLSLNVAHSFPISKSLLEPRTILSLSFLLFIFILLVWMLRKKRLYSFCGFWFFVTLLPVSHIFPHHELLAEHYLYIPSFGLAMAAGLLFAHLLKKERLRLFLYAFLVIILLLYSTRTMLRNLDWKTGVTLWSDAAKKSPGSMRPIVNLGVSYMQKGQYDQAIEAFEKSIEIKKDDPKAYNNLGVLYLEKGKVEEAMTQFKEAISYKPNYADAYNNLAKALALKESTDEAISEEEKAIHFAPRISEYHFNLARLFERRGAREEALREYREALKLDQEFFEARFCLGELYTKLDRNNEAIQEFQKALTLNPASGKTYYFLGANFLKLGNKEKALWNLEQALRYLPDEGNKNRVRAVLERLQSNSGGKSW